MRLATRTGVAALVAAGASMLLIAAAFHRSLPHILEERVDQQLDDRAPTAPILAAVAERLAQSELNAAVNGARVVREGEELRLGRLPDDRLPPVGPPGYSTARADGERWRMLTIEVRDVPEAGDVALVQLVAPLGDVDTRTAELRRRALLVGIACAAVAGTLGYLLGRRATRPLSELRRDADRWDGDDPDTWSVGTDYGSPDVDEVATALNTSLARLGDETARRTAALDAARAFAASATHELRTPLQSARTNIDIARSPLVDDAGRGEAVEHAHRDLERLASGLVAVRALADAEFAELSWFVPTDLGAVVGDIVDGEARRAGAPVAFRPPDLPVVVPVWEDGLRLAVGNLIRNGVVHGGPGGVEVRIDGARVVVDDHGPGVAAADRERVIRRFERAGGSPGSGLGLAIAHQVAVAHGGTLTIGDVPGGGARLTLTLA